MQLKIRQIIPHKSLIVRTSNDPTRRLHQLEDYEVKNIYIRYYIINIYKIYINDY